MIAISDWWFQLFLFSPRTLGKWSNLTSIFFKWVVQPPTRESYSSPTSCYAVTPFQGYSRWVPCFQLKGNKRNKIEVQMSWKIELTEKNLSCYRNKTRKEKWSLFLRCCPVALKFGRMSRFPSAETKFPKPILSRRDSWTVTVTAWWEAE